MRSDTTASDGRYFLLWSNGYIYKDISLSKSADNVTLYVKGDYCGGWPKMVVKVDGARVYSSLMTSAQWRGVDTPISLAAGTHRLEVHFTNDYRTSTCDRNLRVDRAVFTAPDAPPEENTTPPGEADEGGQDAGNGPFEGETLYLNSAYNPARATTERWYAEGRTADAQQMEKIAQTARSKWLSRLNATDHREYVDRATAAGQPPVLTLPSAITVSGHEVSYTWDGLDWKEKVTPLVRSTRWPILLGTWVDRGKRDALEDLPTVM